MVDLDDRMYDQAHFSTLKKVIILDKEENIGVFKIFTYKNSLRISVLLDKSPCLKTVNWLAESIEHRIENTEKNMTLLWYSQKKDFSLALIDRINRCSDPYHFYRYRIERSNINPNVDLNGLEKRRCTDNMIDACIDVMEDLFTPIPDAPGSFRRDRERIKSEFVSDRGGTELFFKEGVLVGFCGHKDGHLTAVCVRKEFQGKGYGEVIVRSVLKSVYELGYDVELTTGHYNERAIALYEKVGFKKLYESIRVNYIR